MSLSIGIVGLPNVGPTPRLLKNLLHSVLSVRALRDCTYLIEDLITGDI